MTFVTLENFNIHKVVLGNIYSTTKPVPYQVIPIKYKYSSSCTGDLVIRTPKLESQGVYENKDKVTQVLNRYSLGLKIPSSDGNREFYDLLLKVTDLIKSKIKTVECSLKTTRKVGVNTENLEIVKYKNNGNVVCEK